MEEEKVEEEEEEEDAEIAAIRGLDFSIFLSTLSAKIKSILKLLKAKKENKTSYEDLAKLTSSKLFASAVKVLFHFLITSLLFTFHLCFHVSHFS